MRDPGTQGGHGAHLTAAGTASPGPVRGALARALGLRRPALLAGLLGVVTGDLVAGGELDADSTAIASSHTSPLAASSRPGAEGIGALFGSVRQLAAPGDATAGAAADEGAAALRLVARVTAAGEPVAGATVSLHDGSGLAPATAVSGADGVAVFEDLAPGLHEVWAAGDGAVSPLARAVVGAAGAGGDLAAADPAQPIALALGPASAAAGRVIGDDGRPLSAELLLVPIDQDHVARPARTDADGQFAIAALPPGRWEVLVHARDHLAPADLVLDTTAGRAELEIRMRRGGVLAGVVLDSSGSPLAGASVILRGAAPGAGAAWRAPARRPTAGPGRLRWVHPLAGPRQLPGRDSRRFGAARDGVRPAECGHGHCGVDVGSARGTVIHAAADGVLSAVVTESRGKAGRFLAIDHPGGLRSFYMHLDEIRADLDPGGRVRAGEPIATMGRTGVVRSGPHLHFAVTQEAGGRSWFVDPEPLLQHAVVLPESGSLEGHMAAALAAAARPAGGASSPRESTVAAAPGAALAAGPPAAGPAAVVTDARGRFRITGVAPGTVVAAAFHPELAPGTSAARRLAAGQEIADLEIQLAAGTIVHGQVRGPAGPIAGARVVAEQGSGESAQPVARAFTGPDGRFTLRPLDGAVELAVSAPGHGAVARAVTLRGRGLTPQRREELFDLERQDAELRGRVVDPRGMPVRGATVRVTSGPVRARRATTDAAGLFVVREVPRGSYELEVLAREYPAARAEADTDAATTITLVQGTRVRLEARDAHTAAALAGVRLEASGPDRARTSVLTGADGAAELAALAPGRWTVRAHRAGYAAATAELDLPGPARAGGPAAPGARVARVVELSRSATLAGVVRDAAGARLAGARVTAGAAATVTDQDGRFRLTDAPTGPVTLRAEHDGRAGSLDLSLAPGDELVTLELRTGD